MRKIKPVQIFGGILIAWTSLIRPLLGGLGDVDTVCNVLRQPASRCGSGSITASILGAAWWQPIFILVGITLILWGERKRYDPLLQSVPNEKVETAEADVTVPTGSTCEATGTVRDATPQERIERVLYTSWIDVDASRLEADHFLHIGIVAFNGSVNALQVANVNGHISTDVPIVTDDGLKAKMAVDLPPPTLAEGTTMEIGPYSEFVVVLEQVLRPATAEGLLQLVGKEKVELDLAPLQIVLWAAEQQGYVSVELPLWNLSLIQADRLWTCKISQITGRATARGNASIG